MKKLALLLLTFVTFGSALMAADVSVSGNLTTQAGVKSDYDFNSDASGDVGLLYADAELNTTVELSDNVKVVLELELNDKIDTTGSAGTGSGDNLDVDEMYLEIGEFFHEALTLKVGHSLIHHGLRKNEKTMYLYLDATAFRLTYAIGEEGSVEAFYAKAVESFGSVNTSSDADVFGVHVEYNFTEDIHAIFYLNNSTWDNAGSDRSSIITVGAGVDAFLLEKSLELFLEVAAQFGEISEAQDHGAFGVDAGVRWNFGEVGSLAGAWVELNVGFRTGADATDPDSTAFRNGYSSDEGAIILENQFDDDSILYNNYYGRTGYLAIRLEGGIDWNEKVKSGMLIGFFDSTVEGVDDPYGIEIDLTSSYQYSENVSMKIAIAVLLADDGLAADADTAVGASFITEVTF